MPWEWGPLQLGLLGALGAEFLSIARFRHEHPSDYPKYLKYWTFYAWTLGFIGIGGVVTDAYASTNDVSGGLAINIGASWPLILEKATGDLSARLVGKTD